MLTITVVQERDYGKRAKAPTIHRKLRYSSGLDGDTLLLLVEQKGVACHTGRKSWLTSLPKERVSDKLFDEKKFTGSWR